MVEIISKYIEEILNESVDSLYANNENGRENTGDLDDLISTYVHFRFA